ncbi:hypothetical protein ABW19_dt0201297 [Dactylella cylindrospora]|nr:hypothetical protein ABW19_dt0201297 [Dactylella cylindrospora]
MPQHAPMPFVAIITTHPEIQIHYNATTHSSCAATSPALLHSPPVTDCDRKRPISRPGPMSHQPSWPVIPLAAFMAFFFGFGRTTIAVKLKVVGITMQKLRVVAVTNARKNVRRKALCI